MDHRGAQDRQSQNTQRQHSLPKAAHLAGVSAARLAAKREKLLEYALVERLQPTCMPPDKGLM